MAYITFRDVDFHYGLAGRLVLRGFNLELERGDFFALVGPSGCGKSTVLNILAGFERATAGEVALDERAVRGPERDRIVIFQEPDSLYPWLTAQENVEFPLRVLGMRRAERRSRAAEALRLVGLRGHEVKHPGHLSGGMKQRVQLARALVLDAPALLMDEPFGALDAQTRIILQEELVQIAARTKRTILFITHDIHEAIFLADRVGVMTAGPEATMKKVVDVNLPRPRQRGSAAFGELYEEVNQILSEEVRRVLRGEDSLL
jgi:NitT/TauT family transport system ATP-binding protein